MRIFLSDKGYNTLQCPICQRELLPAYESTEGLEVGYWSDFEPGEGTEGLLVCANFHCDYEEPVCFTRDRADAVVVNHEHTLFLFEDENDCLMPEAAALAVLDHLRDTYAQTGRAKLRCAIQYYEQVVDDRRERVAAWIGEAGAALTVSFRAGDREFNGQILAVDDHLLTVRSRTGDLTTVPRPEITWERIEYPTRRPSREGPPRFIRVRGLSYMVVQGFHIHCQEPDGELYLRGWTADAEAATALRMQQEGPSYYGFFRRDEVERHYHRREMVKIQGRWLRDRGRTSEDDFVSVETDDPHLAAELGLDPCYNRIWTDFGCREGDEIDHYSGLLPVSLIEETSWYEEVTDLPEPEELLREVD